MVNAAAARARFMGMALGAGLGLAIFLGFTFLGVASKCLVLLMKVAVLLKVVFVAMLMEVAGSRDQVSSGPEQQRQGNETGNCWL